MKKTILYFSVLLLSLFANTVFAQRYIEEIEAFKKQDSISFPPKHAILFVGSSSFRMWKTVQEDFPGYTIINRGFGGSILPDVIEYRNDIIFPYQPKQIVIFCGENDLAISDTVTSKMVVDRFKTLFNLIRDSMPTVPIVFVALKPSPSRERLWPKMVEANHDIRKFLKKQNKANFVDVYSKMFNPDGTVMKDLFLEDMLHMNSKGYAIWQKAIKPYLLKD